MSDLVHLLKRPEFAWLVDRLATRVERGRSLDRGTVSLRAATPDQRRAMDNLLGRRSTSGESLAVDLATLSAKLETDLAEVVQAIRGPLQNRRVERDESVAAWDRMLKAWQVRMPTPASRQWLDSVAGDGTLKRLSVHDAREADVLLRDAWGVLDGAPYDGMLLATLAVRTTGDSHALDRGKPLAALCLRGVHVLHGIDGNRGGGARREAWDALGITVDDLSGPVLCLNLPADEQCELAPWIDWHVCRGEPYFLSWRMVRRFEPASGIGSVFVCENPAVVSEAASRLGTRAQPLVCTQGMPVSALQTLLTKLSNAGTALRVRADFDWTGLRIVDRLLQLRGAQDWRMTLSDYQACNPSQELKGTPFTPTWGSDLAGAMESKGLAAYEEELMGHLIGDLEER